MLKKYILFSIIISYLFLLFSCQKSQDCLQRPGEIDSIEYELDAFNVIDIYNHFNVYIKQDTVEKIVVVGNKNIINLFSFDVVDSCLTIVDNNICNFTRTYDIKKDIYIHTKNLKNVFISGTSKIYSIDTLKFNRLLFRVYSKVSYIDITTEGTYLFLSLWNCTGDYYLHGNGTYLHILSHGTSYIHAFDYDAKFCNITQKSTGDIFISVSTMITAKINEIGNIYYKGEPSEIKIFENTSTGEIIKVE